MSLNRCEFIGNLGRDPEVRTMQTGNKVANLSIGVTEKWKDKNSGERKERTEWVRCVLFGPLADIAEKYLTKGSKVYVAGKMQTRKWTDQSGADKYSTEVVLQGFGDVLEMLDGPKEHQPVNDPARQEPQGSGPASLGDDLSDEIPFAPVFI